MPETARRNGGSQFDRYDTLAERMRGTESRFDVSFGAINVRMDGLQAAINNLGQTIAARSQTPWQAWSLAAIIALALVGGFYFMISVQVTALAVTIDKNDLRLTTAIAKLADDAVGRREYEARDRDIGQRFSRTDEILKEHDANIVKRAEHDALRELDKQRQDILRAEIEDLKTRLAAIYPVNSAFADMQRRIETLEGRIAGAAGK